MTLDTYYSYYLFNIKIKGGNKVYYSRYCYPGNPVYTNAATFVVINDITDDIMIPFVVCLPGTSGPQKPLWVQDVGITIKPGTNYTLATKQDCSGKIYIDIYRPSTSQVASVYAPSVVIQASKLIWKQQKK